MKPSKAALKLIFASAASADFYRYSNQYAAKRDDKHATASVGNTLCSRGGLRGVSAGALIFEHIMWRFTKTVLRRCLHVDIAS